MAGSDTAREPDLVADSDAQVDTAPTEAAVEAVDTVTNFYLVKTKEFSKSNEKKEIFFGNTRREAEKNSCRLILKTLRRNTTYFKANI